MLFIIVIVIFSAFGKGTFAYKLLGFVLLGLLAYASAQILNLYG